MNLLELTLQGGVLIGAILLLRLLGRYRLPGWKCWRIRSTILS